MQRKYFSRNEYFSGNVTTITNIMLYVKKIFIVDKLIVIFLNFYHYSLMITMSENPFRFGL